MTTDIIILRKKNFIDEKKKYLNMKATETVTIHIESPAGGEAIVRFRDNQEHLIEVKVSKY